MWEREKTDQSKSEKKKRKQLKKGERKTKSAEYGTEIDGNPG